MSNQNRHLLSWGIGELLEVLTLRRNTEIRYTLLLFIVQHGHSIIMRQKADDKITSANFRKTFKINCITCMLKNQRLDGKHCRSRLDGSLLALSSGSIVIAFILYVLRFNVPVNNFSVMSGRSHRFLDITSTFGE